ncbi:MAG: ferritin-like domain-containing protein [Euryarchaeota archaeon]|nr:ferritin-like domain-containing protein [Euryarchaeota archaeon]
MPPELSLHTEPEWYEPRLPGESALYSKAKTQQWNAETDVDWSAGPVYYSDAQRVSAARVLSQFLHGEQGALLVCGQLVHMVPDMEAKFYVSSQVFDEARHVEVYGRYMRLLGGVAPVNKMLAQILGEILAQEHWEEKLIGMQILVEGVALRAFFGIREATPDPLLKQILEYTIRDESRHVAYGVMYLRRKMGDITPERRKQIEKTVLNWAMRLGSVYGEEGFTAQKLLWNDMVDTSTITKRMYLPHKTTTSEQILVEIEKKYGPRPKPLSPGAPTTQQAVEQTMAMLDKEPDLTPEQLTKRITDWFVQQNMRAITDSTVMELKERLTTMGLFAR